MNHTDSSIKQLGSSVTAGRDLTAQAGRDISVIASSIDAKRNIAIAATENLTLSSAADEEHSYSKSKKVTEQEDHVSQVSSDLNAGGNVALQAGQDLAVISSRITAGKDALVVAGQNLSILAAQDSDYSLYDMKKKGSFGAKKTQRDEVTDVKNIGSEITTGGDLVLASGGDQKYQVAKLESGKDLTIESGGAVTFEGVKDSHDESHTKSKSSSVWFSSKGKGRTDETLRQSELSAQGQVVINAVEGLQIDVKQVDQQSVSQSIDAMVKADPQLAWLKEAEKRGDVDWHQVKEIHESFKYNNSGLGPAAQIAIAILMAAVMGPAGLGLTGMGGALATSVATNAATSAINNKGDLGAVLKDITSSESLKGYAVSGALAGFAPIDPKNIGLDLAGLGTVADKVFTEALIKTAIMGGSFKDNLGASALGTGVSVAGARIAGKIGDITMDSGKFTKVAMHAALGGLMAEAMGGDFRTGALAAGANEMLVDYLGGKLLPKDADKDIKAYQAGVSKLLTASQLIGVLTGMATGGDASAGATVAANATENNYLSHLEMVQLNKALTGCEERSDCDAVASSFIKKHELNKESLEKICASSTEGCIAGAKEIYEAIYGYQTGEYSNELGQRGRQIEAAFHGFNIAAQADTTEAIISPSAEAFAESLGLDKADPRTASVTAAIAAIITGKATGGPRVAGTLAKGPKVTAGSEKVQATPSFPNQFPDHPTGVPTLISDTKLAQGAGKYNYVVLEDGQLVIGRKFNDVGGGHIDLANGKPVIAAGEVKVLSGKVKYIDNTSGHYEPSGHAAQAAAENAFSQKGFDVAGKYIEKVWVPNPSNPRTGAWVPK
ncbi:DUF637 domain-containing protein [Pseudomonas alliivorans]|nr:DUF637 domain-containing protein [Pseudomonas alliivorans]